MLRPWPRWATSLLAPLAGLAAAAAHPPFGILPGLLAYGLMMRLADGAQAERPLRSAFFRGWLAGVGYFALAAWWVVEPFQVEPDQAWMAPFALVLMAGGLALFWGLAFMLYRAGGPRGFGRALVFAGALSAAEWLRGHLLSGFPWDLPGESWRAGSAPSQAAAWVGAYGLTWITIALGALPALAFDRTSRRRRGLALAAAILGVGLLYGGGAARLALARPLAEPPLQIRVVQANIDQKEKWRPENLGLVFDAYARLSAAPAATPPQVVIWPEGALPAVVDDLLAPGSPYVGRLEAMLSPGQTLFMGANRAGLGKNGKVEYYNSLIALRREALGLSVTGIYDKRRLVPFGEFMPLGGLAGKIGLRSLVHMPDDFTPGPEPRPLSPAGLPPVQPLICYEALFPHMTSDAAARAGLRPAWIVNISNDAWFGVTSGPWQHLNMASYRAIEEGLPVVRATPTGVSAVIDAFGRSASTKRLEMGKMGQIDARLPPRLQATLYSRFAETFFFVMLLVSALILGAIRIATRR
jgi:apolipoprotein N-acyltransferase